MPPSKAYSNEEKLSPMPERPPKPSLGQFQRCHCLSSGGIDLERDGLAPRNSLIPVQLSNQDARHAFNSTERRLPFLHSRLALD